jgi:RNA polymerase sigma factor (sigma-70 family)
MHTKSDAQLLREYAEHGVEAAFTEIVIRHTDLVYSAALRHVASPDIAREIAQSVFMSLARTARVMSPQLAQDASLAGWLCRSARNVSLTLRRDQLRRYSRERQAMEDLNTMPDVSPDWEQLRSVLDDAMAQLSENDYDALVMRFFKNQDLRSVGLALGISDDAAQKRVSRALDKLRETLAQRGLTTSAAALSTIVSANAVQAAPAALALIISNASLSAGATLCTSAAAANIQALTMTTLQKAVLAMTLAAVGGTVIYQAQRVSSLRSQIERSENQHIALVQRLQRERDQVFKQVSWLETENARLKSSQNTAGVLRLRGELAQLKAAAREQESDPDASAGATVGRRVSQLKKWFQQNPSECIPELESLPLRSWLKDAGELRGDLKEQSDFGLFASRVRLNAKAEFAYSLGEALGSWLVANNGELPNDLSELKSYIPADAHVDEAAFQRYRLLRTGNVRDFPQTEPLVAENEPIQNGQYDALFKIGALGYSYKYVAMLNASDVEHGNEFPGPPAERLLALFKH